MQREAERGAGPDWPGFRDGAVASLPVLPAVAPFGLIFGTLAIETGLGAVEALAMASLVIAGAAQLTALQLLAEGAPYAVIVATAAAVNLRMAMYSASLAPHWRGVAPGWKAAAAALLFDQDYALAMARYRQRPEEGPGRRIGYFLGAAVPIMVVWIAATVAGISVGTALPEELGLDFFVPLAFLAIVAPMLRGRGEVVACAVAVVVGTALHGLPFRAGLFIAAGAGILAGMAARRTGR